jgi:tetratricopeptide (TPR) repeat protein
MLSRRIAQQRKSQLFATVAALSLSIVASAGGQQPAAGPAPVDPAMRAASQLDLEGRTTDARVIFQKMIDSASTPLAKATAQRAMAMSYAFDADCANTVKYEEMVIAYWKTREAAEPQNAFYQEGEMANEAARVCIDAGDLDTADRYYRMGSELGLKEPDPKSHPRALWDFRLHHALGRLAARLGDAAEAKKQIAAARSALDSDTAVARQQERFFPYLVGYVALYTNDLMGAFTELTKAVAMRGNERDPFMHFLLAVTYDRLGNQEKARPLYQKAYDLATGHNPPAAYVRPQVRKKLGLLPAKP